MIYLDFAASTPLLPSVQKELFRAFEEEYSNPSSAHKLGRSSSEKIENVRDIIANSIGAYKSEIIFTSGASESNNLAIKGYVLANKDKGKHIITSLIEHKCILSICNFLEKEYGYEITYISPQKNGIIDAQDVISAMREDTVLVSIMHVNNELGSIQPISAIGQACFERDIKFHVDAAQSFKKIPIDVDKLNIDMLSLSAHKIYGPKGIGALYIRDLRETRIQPVIHGAGQEYGLRGGTLATPLILGFGAAVEDQTIEDSFEEVNKINSLVRDKVIEIGGSFNTPEINFIPHILNIRLPNFDSSHFVANSDFLCSQGSACSSMNIEMSYVLREIGVTYENSIKSLRLSLDYNSKYDLILPIFKFIIEG
ncbi:cysteine desulfurase family protein [Acinetobacter calcoaceticus]|uniref:cysteine desulfurase n=1 Tax=Acinetobacter calcoaceticus TaxID=471 RepID=A0ABD5AM51_ACICA|nr:cysteine desulfurase family protein [Acinetobacter calcoaceticus]MDP9803401.1 cysteine desulfurase [Acinetobacter calcoaceticus]